MHFFVALNMLFPRQLLASFIAVKFNSKKRQKNRLPLAGRRRGVSEQTDSVIVAWLF